MATRGKQRGSESATVRPSGGIHSGSRAKHRHIYMEVESFYSAYELKILNILD